jgi:nucleoside-diphosphate-sugar epimerase
MLAFVTGASGFIGSHLVEALVQGGRRVRCLVRASSRTQHLAAAGAELVCGSFDQPELLDEALRGADTVFHLAALTAALTAEELFRVNERGCRAIAEACSRQPRPPRLVIVSSVAAAGPIPRGQIRVESDPDAPISNYGRSKLAGEQAAAEFADRVPMTIVRPGIVFGPRNRSMLPIFQTIRYFNVHPIPGYHQPALSYVYVSDLVELLLRAAERGQALPAGGSFAGNGARRGIYFVAAGEYPTYADFGRMAGRMLQRPYAVVLPCLPPIPWAVAGVSEFLQRLRGKADKLNFDKIREATATSWACSAAAARRDLDFQPPKSLEERLSETVRWYRQAGWL